MNKEIHVEYNNLGYGPKISYYGEKSVIIMISTFSEGIKKTIKNEILDPGHFFLLYRQFYQEWIIESYTWNNGELVKFKTDIFNPHNKKVHIYLDNSLSCLPYQHKEYVLACIDFLKKWEITDYVIESQYLNELKSEFPNINIVDKITNNDCYVNFNIKRDVAFNDPFEELVFFNNTHPHNYEDFNDYEFAKQILFGPDYSKINTYIPHGESLKN